MEEHASKVAEIRVWDVLPKLGWKGEMGRVVVSKNEEGVARAPHVTGTFYWCCKRAFLSWDSFQKHQRSGGCRNKVEQTPDSDDDEITMPATTPQNNIVKRGRGRPKKSANLNNEIPQSVPCNINSKAWFTSERTRKISNLNKTDDGIDSNKAFKQEPRPFCKTERVVKREVARAPTPTPSSLNVMSFINLGTSANGMIVLSCKKCDFTSGETAIISEHILKTHFKPPEQTPVHHPPEISTSVNNEDVSSKVTGSSSTDKKRLLRCDLCKLYTTAISANLELHKKYSHGPNNPFPCKLCSCAYASQQGLTKHVNKFHKNTENSRHSSTTENKKANFGSSTRYPKTATCNLCGFASYSMSKIKKHKLTAHVHNGKYPCPICSCVHDTRMAATLHLKSAHEKNVSAPVSNTGKVTAVVKPSTKSSLIEKWVEQTLEQHELEDNADIADEQHQDVTDEEHELSDEEMSGLTRSASEVHALPKTVTVTAAKAGPFKCHLCPREFARKCHFVLHSRSAHLKPNTSVKNLATKGAHETRVQDRRCSPCQRTFTTAYLLALHNSTCHVPGGTFPCPIERCKCVMNAYDSLKNHIARCRFREQIGITLPLNDKSKTSAVTETALACNLCGFVADNKTELDTHSKDSHVICGVECICGCTFATATELTHHKNNECPKSAGTLKIVNVVSMATPGTSRESTSSGDFEPFAAQCSCGKKYTSRSELLKHKRNCNHHKKKENENLKQMIPTEPSTVHQQSSETDVRCLECNKSFRNEKGLMTHCAAMHAPQIVNYDSCEICGSHTAGYVTYNLHKKSCHVKDGIPCPECPYTLRTIEGLRIHFYMLHKCQLDVASLEIRCSECDYVTFKPAYMENHKKIGHITKPPKEKKIVSQCEHENCTFEGTEYAIECHAKTSHVENGFKCRLCSYSFATQTGRRTHLKAMHENADDEFEDEKVVHKCQLCEYSTTNSKDFERHSEKNHVEGGFKCDYCGNSLTTEAGLGAHIRTLHEKEADFSKCNLCDYKPANKRYYKRHMTTHHVEDGVQCPGCPCTLRNVDGLSMHAWMVHKIRIDKNDYKLNCKHCDFKTIHLSNLRHHMRTVHSVTAMNKRTEDQATCELCGAKMAHSFMDYHISRAHVEGGHPCPYCSCSFVNQNGLQKHARVRHGKKLTFTKELDPSVFVESCTVCEMRFRTKAGLSSHCVRNHGFATSGSTKRKCDLCHAEFTETIAGHLKRYHVENGFKCLHCCCSFETFAGRSRHMIKAHKVLLVKNCNICGNRFMGTIKTHIAKCHVDNGVPCEFCCCTFESLQGKLVHERKIHNSVREKGTTCDLCKFTVSGTLQEHMMRCHVPNGVPCSYCPSSFQTEQGRIQHNKLRHKVTVTTRKICDLCGIFPLGPMKYHLKQSHVPNGIRCSHCSCSFKGQMSKTRHLLRYHNIQPKQKITPRKCTLCGVTLRLSLQSHLRKHHVKNGFPCGVCSCSYLTQSQRKIHLLKAHNKRDDPNPPKKGVPHCRLCGQVVLEEMADHMTRNHLHTNSFKCNRCVCRFKTIDGLEQHSSEEHKESDHSPDADSESITANSEPEQMQTNQSDFVEKITPNLPTSANPSIVSPIKERTSLLNNRKPGGFKCSLCPRKFPTKTGLKIHAALGHINSSNKAKKQGSSNQDLGRNSATANHSSDNSDTDDEDADKSPSSNSSIVRNVQPPTSIPKEKLTCAKCGYLATSLSQLNFHLQKSHVKNSLFPCTKCTCGFAKEAELQRHQKVLHHK